MQGSRSAFWHNQIFRGTPRRGLLRRPDDVFKTRLASFSKRSSHVDFRKLRYLRTALTLNIQMYLLSASLPILVSKSAWRLQ